MGDPDYPEPRPLPADGGPESYAACRAALRGAIEAAMVRAFAAGAVPALAFKRAASPAPAAEAEPEPIIVPRLDG